ncbi:NAD(P)-dependent oxidoreductase [Mycolicibacterium septicum DSM 44393]|uniref:NAD(P)-dependent oxidoreductase n=1 Tax=Mycolicibacterium septicum DSM 44393 TaxID=1341646 RepID=A0A7X6MLJ8_9MYCO|nr:NAD(P)-dependent oxidoreductase [Mycolicibacterium septicum]NKZ10820.1 NAD(P)-dependent oxidoreductase [Mycolicibacterium septicum DSM 44393]
MTKHQSALHPDAAVTFVGLGMIGRHMALRVAAHGFRVTGVDPMPAAHEWAQGKGIAATSSLVQAPSPDVVIVMVATPEQMAAVVDDALHVTVAGERWILMSTVGPDAIQKQALRLSRAGAHVIDVPVTGGVARARTGDLTLFAAGSKADLDAVSPVLEAMGKIREVGGEVGAGQSFKLVNQLLCTIHIVAAAEALALADRLKLDPARVLTILQEGSAASWMLSSRGPRMLAGADFEPTSTVGIFVKDSALVEDAARTVGASVPLLQAARDRFNMASDSGLTSRDDSSVIETYPPKPKNPLRQGS